MANYTQLKRKVSAAHHEYLSDYFVANGLEKHITIGENRYAKDRFDENLDALLHLIVDEVEKIRAKSV